MRGNTSLFDKGQVYDKVVYVYFCFFSMFVTGHFSMSILYGAALFFSLSALFRMFGFTLKTTYDSRWLRGIKTAVVVFFLLSTAYIILLYPFLFTYRYEAICAIVIVVLPFFEREIENTVLRRHAGRKSLKKPDIIKVILPIELTAIVVTSLAALWVGTEAFVVVLLGMLVGMGLLFFRQAVFHDYAAEFPRPGAISRDAKEIRSVRLYDGMVITSGTALNIFAFTYVLFIIFSGGINFFIDFFVVFAGLALVFCIIYLAIYRAVRSPVIQKIGGNAAFLFGTAICIFAVYIFRSSWVVDTLAISVQTLLLLVGIVLQITATYSMKEDIFLVIKLNNQDADRKAFHERTARLNVWTAVISETVALAVLIVLISNPLFSMMNVADYIVYAPYIGSSVIVIPTVFLVISLIYSIKQPITKKYEQMLKKYEQIKKQGKENLDLKKRLTSVLVKRYKKRIGVHVIRLFLKPIMYHTITGKSNVNDLPGIFVFNHGEFYGPIAAVVFLPYPLRPWIYYKMIDKNEITSHIFNGTFKKIKWLPNRIGRAVSKALSPIIVWALNSFDPIPVYRGVSRSIIKTFSLSIACLNAGDSILLFPENPEEEYGETLNAFYTGFANLGRLYYKKTGKEVTFYPVFASKRNRVLRIGEGIRYDSNNGKQERDRIVTILEQRMQEMQSLDR